MSEGKAMSLHNKLNEFCRKENIAAGIGSADSFDYLKELLKNKHVPFVSYTVEERTEPSLTMKDAKSIIAIGLSYNTVYKKINDGKLRGNMSAGAVGTDYHTVVREKLERLKNEVLGSCRAIIFTDTGPLSDRDVALRCSLGVRGKNGSIINKSIGGMFFIGYILTDMYIEPDKNEEKDQISCGSCQRCIKACPNNALSDGKCDYTKCISYLTQKKGVLTDNELESIGRQIYGCDVCQRACPFNKDFSVSTDERAYPDIEQLLSMSNKDFKNTYGSTAAGWRGKRTLQRNALAVLGNIGDEKTAPLIERFIDSEHDELRTAAEFAMKKVKRC